MTTNVQYIEWFVTNMNTLRWVVLLLALIQAGWLMFDGTRALIAGDFVTPSSGPHAGQLGPWSRLVSAVGLEPRSTLIKVLHLLLGVAWLAAAILFVMRPPAGWWMLFACGV